MKCCVPAWSIVCGVVVWCVGGWWFVLGVRVMVVGVMRDEMVMCGHVGVVVWCCSV